FHYGKNLRESRLERFANSSGYQLGTEIILYNFSRSLERLSLDFSLDLQFRNFPINGVLARTQESAVSMGVLVYFFNTPLDVRSMIFYTGVYVKMGNALVYNAQDEGNKYMMKEIPRFELGSKYRFTKTFGAALNFVYGRIH